MVSLCFLCQMYVTLHNFNNFYVIVCICVVRSKKLKRNNIPCLIPFLDRLEAVKEKDHVLGGFSLIRSLEGCPKQDDHTDYYSYRKKGKQIGLVHAYSCLISLEDQSSIYIGAEKVSVPRRAAVIFRGDVVHSGSDYTKDNIRYHLYMDVKNVYEAKVATHICWVDNKQASRVEEK